MLNHTIIVDNLKCGGCANTIQKSLRKIPQVKEVYINLDTSEVNVALNEALLKEHIVSKLRSLGYPEHGTSNTVQRAKSYLSCALGRVS